MEIGDTWNESEISVDALTGRRVRRLTSRGTINQTPTYHTNSGFTEDGSTIALVSVRDGATWIIAGEAETGDLKAVWRTPGIGDRNYIHRGMDTPLPGMDGGGLCGNRLCVAPKSRTAVFTAGRRILAVDLGTCRTRVLLEDCGDEWIFGAPAVSPDEKSVAVCLSSSHPEMRGGAWTMNPRKSYLEYTHTLRIVRVPLSGQGEPEILYEHPEPAQSAHCAFCPADGSLLYFDLDLAPRYWCGGDGRTPRIWMLDVEARKARLLKEHFPGYFPTHTAWLWDGSAICYHGNASTGGEYFGVAKPDGETLWEEVFPKSPFYGHNTPDARRKALIIDGTFSSDLLQWLSWGEPTGGQPKLVPICRHGTEWGSLAGQYSHPHPLTDSMGNWISYTSAHGGRSDVFVVDVRDR